MVNNLLINFPTNLGDVIIGLPVLDRLRANYPDAKITAVASPKTKTFLLNNTSIDEVVVFDKKWLVTQKLKFSLDLRGKYDLIVDLKNTFFPFILGVKARTPFWRNFPKGLHAKEEYLRLIEKIAPKETNLKSEFILAPKQEKKWQKFNLKNAIFIACSSKERLKQYPYEYLKKVIESLKDKYRLVILGLTEERNFYKDILSLDSIVNLVGDTQMEDVYFLLKNYAALVLCVDSSIMHMASYLDLPIVALFGTSDPQRYGPWSSDCLLLRRKEYVASLPRTKKYSALIEYMKIDPQEVLHALGEMMDKYVKETSWPDINYTH